MVKKVSIKQIPAYMRLKIQTTGIWYHISLTQNDHCQMKVWST